MEQRDFKSFFKDVADGNESRRCHYTTRLDTYGCGCAHDCRYCYAKSLLSFRGLWKPNSPAVADISEIRKVIQRELKEGDIVRLGGMTDCFQPIEREQRVTYQTIQALNAAGVGYLIVTKSALIAGPEYREILDKRLAHIQVSITTTDNGISKHYEPGASLPDARINAIETLAERGYDAAIRLSPYIPEFVNIDKINAIRCDKIIVEFLRVNVWIERWMKDINLSPYTLVRNGYRHLPLAAKKNLIARIHKKEISVCEDVYGHWVYWKENLNINPNDCCNLRK